MQEKQLLKTILENLQTKISSQIFNAYFSEITILEINENSVKVSCKNTFTKQAIETRYFQTLLNSAKTVLGRDNLNLELIVKNIATSANTAASTQLFATATTNFQKNNAIEDLRKIQSSFLNPKYTFDSFIVGNSSQLAHAAALAIADNPGNAYNPFFIYGGVGLGKTHLMQAVGHEILKNNPNAKVLYCSTESFLNEMVTSIRTQKGMQFREKYRALDLLLLDDIQFISNKEMLQEEFFNTFNTLYQSGKQMIIASDRPPSEIAHLEDRIRSRFEGGLVADVKSPNVETRVAILQKKLIDRNEYLPESVIFSVAENVDSNIRELEGALLKVSIFAKTNDGQITVSDVESLLGDRIIARKKKINPLDIMNCICEELEVSLKDVKSAKRNYDIAYARQLCMYLLKDILKLQLVKIARHVGRSDHTTIMHGISKIEKMIEKDQEVARQVQELKAKIL
jgi:chromosomal replication initiator protein